MQGGQIGWFFAHLPIFRPYIWKLIMIFWKDEVTQRNGDILDYFLASSFKTWFVEGILRFQKWFDVDILDF